jgi:hypothetical protein
MADLGFSTSGVGYPPPTLESNNRTNFRDPESYRSTDHLICLPSCCLWDARLGLVKKISR